MNHTAAAAEITEAMTGPGWRVAVVGARTVSRESEQLLGMPQATVIDDRLH